MRTLLASPTGERAALEGSRGVACPAAPRTGSEGAAAAVALHHSRRVAADLAEGRESDGKAARRR